MNTNQQLLIDLLSAAIRNEKPQLKINSRIDWEAVFLLARYHRVETLLFPVLKKLEKEQRPNIRLLSNWHQVALADGLHQIKFIARISEVLQAFTSANIQVNVLKGLFLRYLYPFPELREMCDADMLVQKKDLDCAKKLLINLGYVQDGSIKTYEKNIGFIHQEYTKIELHWTLIAPGHVFNSQCFESGIWSSPIPFTVSEVPTNTLSIENHILHLCLHMATHFLSGGFGLRQLCDLVLLVESNKRIIDWKSVRQKAKECAIEKFLIASFQTCKKLFNLNIDNISSANSAEEDRYLEKFKMNIFLSGAYGRSSLIIKKASGLIRIIAEEKKVYPQKYSGEFKYFISYVFPSAKNLPFRFTKGRKYPFLYPIAWVERLIKGIFFMHIPFIELLRLLKEVGSCSKLLQWLNLW